MRFSLKMGVLAGLAAALAYLGSPAAADEKKEGIKGCMALQNTVRGDWKKQLKAKDVNWENLQKETKEWLAIAQDLGSHKPPKGDDKSWKEQTERYLTNVKAINAAAEKKDKAEMTKTLEVFGNSCMGCHSKHRAK